MSFKVVGKGNFTKEALIEQLKVWGIANPLSVIQEAEKGRALCGGIRILAVR